MGKTGVRLIPFIANGDVRTNEESVHRASKRAMSLLLFCSSLQLLSKLRLLMLHDQLFEKRIPAANVLFTFDVGLVDVEFDHLCLLSVERELSDRTFVQHFLVRSLRYRG